MYLSNSESIIISRFLEVWYLQENGACRSRLDQCKPFITVNYEGAQNVSFVISSQLKFDPFQLVWCHNLVFVFLSGQKLTTHLLDLILYWRFMCWLIVPWHLVFIFWNLSNRKCFPCWIAWYTGTGKHEKGWENSRQLCKIRDRLYSCWCSLLLWF